VDIILSIWLVFDTHGLFLLWLILAFFLGALMLRHQRLAVLFTLFRQTGDITSLFWLARYYVAALFFIWPGVLSDIFAILLLLPWKGAPARPVSAEDIIEAEFTQVNPEPPRQLPPKDE
jgi:UPF0716 protein FxsA